MGMKAGWYGMLVKHFQSKHLQDIVDQCCFNVSCILFIKP